MEQVSESRLLDEALSRWAGSLCPDCGANLCDHGVLCAVALGLRDRPRCLPCAAKGLNRDPLAMRQHLGRWLAGKDCYKKAWLGADPGRCGSPCGISGLLAINPDNDADESAEKGGFADSGGRNTASDETPAIVHDFGDLGCGDLVLQLRRILREAPAGTLIRVVATDPGAPEDIPAWIRMTGHGLVGASHPVYDLRKRADS